MMPKEAISSPRFQTYHVENSFNPSADPDSRLLNMGVLGIYQTNQSEIEDLRNRGHKVELVSEIARPVMVFLDQESGIVFAAGEPGYKHCAAITTVESPR